MHCCWPPVTSEADISKNQSQHTKHCGPAHHSAHALTTNSAWRRGGGRQDRQSCTAHWQALHYAWCVPLYTASWWLEQVDVEVMWWKKMCWLYMTVWANVANQNYGRGEEGQFNCTVNSQQSAYSCVASTVCWLLNNELERMWQVVAISQLAVLSQQLYEVTKDNHTIHKHLEQSVSKPQYKPNFWIQYLFIKQCCQQFELWTVLSGSCESAVGTQTRLWAEWSGVLFLTRTRHFYTLQNVQTSSGAHPASYSTGTEVVNWLGLKMTIQPQVSGLRITGAVPLLLLHACKAWSKKLYFLLSTLFSLDWVLYITHSSTEFQHVWHKYWYMVYRTMLLELHP